jgi:hypothetical protein
MPRPYAFSAGDIFGLAFPLKIFTVPQLVDRMLPDLSHVFPRGVDGSDAYNASHPRPGLLFAWWSIASECGRFCYVFVASIDFWLKVFAKAWARAV